MENSIGLSEEELFETVVEEALMQGVSDEPAFFDLIDEIIEDLRGEGELDTDQNLDGHATHLKARFAEYQDRLLE